MITFALREEFLAHGDDVRKIDVVPANAWSWVDAIHARIQTTPEMEHGRFGVCRKKRTRPIVEMSRPYGQADGRAFWQFQRLEVEIDTLNGLRGEPIPQNRVLLYRIERFTIKCREV